MIITFGTQKGGGGKTTLAIAFANYLSSEHKKTVNVLDLDFQKSFYQKWLDDKDSDDEEPYQVTQVSKEEMEELNSPNVLNALRNSDQVYLFDLEGAVNKAYSGVLKYSNSIIVPFSYSDITVNSTIVFVNLCNLLKIQGDLYFVRNNIDKNGNYVNQTEMDVELAKHGTLLEGSVYKRNCLQTISTRKLDYRQKLAVKDVFDELIYGIYGNNE